MSIYDLYQSYLNQLQNPVVQQSPLFDYRLLYPPVQQDGGDSMGGGITQLSPQQIQDRAMQQEFDASALRDEQGNVIGGLTKEEQELMDQARGKGRLSGFDKFNIGNMFLGGGIPSMIQLGISRRMGQNQGLEGLRQLANLSNIGFSGVTKPGTYGYDDSGVGGGGTGGVSMSSFDSQGFGSEGNTNVSTDFGSFDFSRD
jgi:hypothetical protein